MPAKKNHLQTEKYVLSPGIATIYAAIIAVIGIVIGAFLNPLAQKLFGQTGVNLPSVQSVSCDEYNIKIVSPQNHAEVPVEFELAGTFEKQPPEGSVVVYLTPLDHKTFWPQSAVEFDSMNKSWRAQARLLGDPKSGPIEGDYLIALVGKTGRLYYDYFWKVNNETGSWVYFNDLTEDTTICAQVSVKRTK
jgi:hypothetical protein